MSPGDPAAWGPPLLDQATSRQLAGAASGVAPGRRPEWSRPRSTTGPTGRSPARRLLGLLLPLSLFSLGAFTVAGLLTGAARAMTDADGVTAVDAALIAVMLMATTSLLGQARGLLRRGYLRLRGSTAAAPPPSPDDARWAGPWLVDQVPDEALAAAAPDGLGEVGLPSALVRRQRRALDTLLWLVIVAATLLLAGSVAVWLGSSVADDLRAGSSGPATILRGVFTILAGIGWALIARTGLDALLHRRRRRRRSALMRLLRYLLRLLRGAVRPGPIGLAPAFSLMVLAAVAVTAYGFGPALAGPGGFGSEPGAGPSPTPGSSATESPAASPAATATPRPSSKPSPSASATAAASPAPSGTPSPTPPGPTPRPTPLPTPTPTPTPSPTIDPGLNSDQDVATDVLELLYGSDRFNPLSTPEHLGFDQQACFDGLDNDGDLLIDWNGGTLPDNSPVGPDPGCQ